MHQCTNPSNEVTNNKTGITKYRTPRETKGFGIQCSGLEWVTYEATYVCALCSLAECVTQLEGSETAVVGMSEWGDEGLGCRPTRQRRKTLQERGWGRGGGSFGKTNISRIIHSFCLVYMALTHPSWPFRVLSFFDWMNRVGKGVSWALLDIRCMSARHATFDLWLTIYWEGGGVVVFPQVKTVTSLSFWISCNCYIIVAAKKWNINPWGCNKLRLKNFFCVIRIYDLYSILFYSILHTTVLHYFSSYGPFWGC